MLLEVATWNGPNIHRSSWALGLRSEASARFEKGLAPEQCMHAQAVATQLMIELCGATVAPGTIDVGGVPEAPAPIHLRSERVRSILGVEVTPRAPGRDPARRSTSAPSRRTTGCGSACRRCAATTSRREVDLIEEVARIDGLERLPTTLPARRGAAGRLTHAQRVRRGAEDLLAGRGLSEIVGWSFTEPGLLDRLRLPDGHELRRVVTLENPLSEDLSIMRPTLMGSLLDAARHNAHRNGPDLALFESGTVYRAREDGPGADEHHALGALLSGALAPPSWRGQAPAADFFAAKALLEALLDHFHVAVHRRARELALPAPRPQRGRAAGRRPADPAPARRAAAARAAGRGAPAGGRRVGSRTHGRVRDRPRQARAGRPGGARLPRLRRLPARAPGHRRGRARAGRPWASSLERVREAAGDSLEQVRLFDVYTGEQVGEGRRSLALALAFRSPERTLTDEDVAPVRERIVAAIVRLGGELRG